MANTINSTNMILPIPVVGTQDGPQYATDINNCFTLVDAHDHSPGRGVAITPSGLNINAELTLANNNLIAARSIRFQPQVTLISNPADLGCLYESGVDLYYNDGVGNQVRITQSGGVAGSPGSISNLTSPASASYVAATDTFVWQSDANVAANLDARSILLRNSTASSNALTLSPPTAMGSNFTLTLPSLPLATNIMTLDASGAMAAAVNVDNASIQLATNILSIKDQGVTQAKLALRATGTTVAAGGIAVSASSGAFAISATATMTPVTNLSVTITTLGRPVRLAVVPDGGGTVAQFGYSTIVCAYFRGATNISQIAYEATAAGAFTNIHEHIDVVAAGTYTYTFQVSNSGVTASIAQFKLIAYET